MTSPVADMQARAASLVGDAYIRGFEHGVENARRTAHAEVEAELAELRSVAVELLRHVEEDCVPMRNGDCAAECRKRLAAQGVSVGVDDATAARVAEAKAALMRALPGVRVPKHRFGEVVYTLGDCQCAAFIAADGTVSVSAVGEPASVRDEFARRVEAWGAALRGPDGTDGADGPNAAGSTTRFSAVSQTHAAAARDSLKQ